MVRSSAFASAGQIFHASIGSCSNEVLAILPKESVIKRTVNNHKALPPIELVGVNAKGQIPKTYSRPLGTNPQLCSYKTVNPLSFIDRTNRFVTIKFAFHSSRKTFPTTYTLMKFLPSRACQLFRVIQSHLDFL